VEQEEQKLVVVEKIVTKTSCMTKKHTSDGNKQPATRYVAEL